MEKQGRNFTLALKTNKNGAITKEYLDKILSDYKGQIEMHYILHDKDFNEETGEPKEPHFHILLQSRVPYRISTIANIFEVEPNMVEIVRNYDSMLRYLIHADNKDKAQYEINQVKTNSNIDYEARILKGSITDKMIFEDMLENGTNCARKYLDIIPSYKLNQIRMMTRDEHIRKIDQRIQEVTIQNAELKEAVHNIEAYNRRTLEIMEEFLAGIKMFEKEAPQLIKLASADIGKCIVIISKGMENIAKEINRSNAQLR